MDEVQWIERILGHEYGTESRIVKNTAVNRFRLHVQAEGLSQASLLAASVKFLFNKYPAFYDDATNTICVP